MATILSEFIILLSLPSSKFDLHIRKNIYSYDFILFNATFNNISFISWLSVLLVDKTTPSSSEEIPRERERLVTMRKHYYRIVNTKSIIRLSALSLLLDCQRQVYYQLILNVFELSVVLYNRVKIFLLNKIFRYCKVTKWLIFQ
jgi:hypothetical protein